MLVAQHHGGVNVLGAGHAVGQHANGFVAEHHAQAAGGKPGDVLDENGGFAHGFAGCFSGGDRTLSGQVMTDQFEQFHDGNGIEEMHANDLLWPGRSSSDVGDGKRGGVGAEHGVSRGEFVELCEDAVLQLGDFWHGFNHEVGLSDRFGQVANGGQVGRPCVSLLRGGFPSCDALLPEGCDALHTTFKPLGKGIVEVGFPAGLGAHLCNTGSHRSGAHHGHALNGHGPCRESPFMMLARWFSVWIAPR